MPEDQGEQPEIPNDTVSEPEAEAIATDLADQPTTTPPIPETPRSKVVGVDEYHKRLAAAMAPAPVEEPKQGEPAEEPSEPEPEPEPEAENAEPTEESAEELPPAAETVPEPQKKEFRPRLGSLSERKQEAILLVKTLTEGGEDISLAEAEHRVNLKYGVDDKKPETPAAPVRTIEQVLAEIAEKKAAADNAAEQIDIKAALNFEREARELEDEARKIKADEEAKEQAKETAADAKFQREVDEADATARSLYSCMSDENHRIHARAREIFASFQASGNPLAYQSNAPLRVYQMAANEMGIAPSNAAAKPKNGSSPSTTPKPQSVSQRAVGRPNPAVTPASGAARTTTPGLPSLSSGKRPNAQEYVERVARLGVRVA